MAPSCYTETHWSHLLHISDSRYVTESISIVSKSTGWTSLLNLLLYTEENVSLLKTSKNHLKKFDTHLQHVYLPSTK